MFLQEATNALQSYYTLVYDQQLSSCGKYLAACDSFGHIGVFRSELAGSILDPFAEVRVCVQFSASVESFVCRHWT